MTIRTVAYQRIAVIYQVEDARLKHSYVLDNIDSLLDISWVRGVMKVGRIDLNDNIHIAIIDLLGSPPGWGSHLKEVKKMLVRTCDDNITIREVSMQTSDLISYRMKIE